MSSKYIVTLVEDMPRVHRGLTIDEVKDMMQSFFDGSCYSFVVTREDSPWRISRGLHSEDE